MPASLPAAVAVLMAAEGDDAAEGDGVSEASRIATIEVDGAIPLAMVYFFRA